MPRPASLSAAHVRRTVVAAQGLAGPRPAARLDRRHLRRVVRTFGLVQIDSVNVLARAHHVPFFSRLGAYDTDLLHRMAYHDRELFEYWGHAASLVAVELHPFLRWRMAERHPWRGPASVATTRPGLIEAVVDAVHADGPLSAAEIAEHLGEDDERRGPWWGWGDTKRAIEVAFHAGLVGALRRGSFERVYCHPELAVPPEVLAVPTPDEATAKRALLTTAVVAHGVATAGDLADYWRLKTREVQSLLRDLVAEGAVETVEVEGWSEPGYVSPDVTIPRRLDACALVSPFDPAMWSRPRIERIHDFNYTIEIYLPEAERVYGYYSLPFLLGDTFVARVDLKADRQGDRLVVRAAHAEDDLAARGTDRAEVVDRLVDELALVVEWLGLGGVTVEKRGDLARPLAEQLSASP